MSNQEKPIIQLMLTAECLERLAKNGREELDTPEARVVIKFGSLANIPPSLRSGMKGGGTYYIPHSEVVEE